MAENYFIQTEEISQSTESGSRSLKSQSEDTEVWETPRASWLTTSDGYIEALEIDKAAMKAVNGYSKIIKNKKYDKIITEVGPQQLVASANELKTCNSQITLSHNRKVGKLEIISCLN